MITQDVLMDPFSVLKLSSAPELNGLLSLSSELLLPFSGPPLIKRIKKTAPGLSIKKNGNRIK